MPCQLSQFIQIGNKEQHVLSWLSTVIPTEGKVQVTPQLKRTNKNADGTNREFLSKPLAKMQVMQQKYFLFASSLSSSGCSHVGSIFGNEAQ